MTFSLGGGLGRRVGFDESCIVGWLVEGLELCSEVGVTSGVPDGSESDSVGFAVGRIVGFELCCDVGPVGR